MLKDNLLKVLHNIKNGNNLGEKIYLVGATKTMPVETINNATSLGLEIVAENKVSEFREKHGKIINAKEHFIGHLQTNKVKYIVGQVELIHSVDSLHLAQAISDRANKIGVTQDILVQINVGKEETKSGFYPDIAIESVKAIAQLQNINVCGLMAMLPPTDDQGLLKKLCLQMREFFDKLNNDGYNLKYLSVGMSADYQIAIQNGSNMIRLGSTIFGKRNYDIGETK